ncbi:MAG: hypothetical protein HW400_280 [Candidatus Levybacteria bacterium]|nr:hypothetical protein [Candidatus Levybacteria bacterium]
MAFDKQNSQTRLQLLSRQYRDGGQVLLFVILAVLVLSTIGLSSASKIITSLKSTTEEAESQKALAAAEAGIERELQNSVPIGLSGQNPSNKSDYTTTSQVIKGTQILLNGGLTVPKDEGADLWLSTYDPNPAFNYGGTPWSGDLTIYWGNSVTACENPALEIIIVLAPKNTPVLKKYAFDPCPARQSENHFSVPSSGGSVSGKAFPYGLTIAGVSSALITRIIPIYGNTSIGLSGTMNFPTQGYRIDSTGTSGQANRKIRVFKGWPQTYLPYLSYGLFVANSF